jgi:carboxyl-terminal processing protease
MKKYIIFLVLILIMPISAWAQPETDHFSTIHDMIQIISKNYVEPVSEQQLMQGAVEGLKYCFKKQKLVFPELLPINDFSGFKAGYLALLAANPKLNEEDAYYASLAGIIASLKDPHSTFLTAGNFKALLEQMQDEGFGGIGVYIEMDEASKYLKVAEVMEDSPAQLGGLRANDLILSINGHSTLNFTIEQAQTHIRGQIGTKVELMVKRLKPAKKFKLLIKREEIKRKALSSKVLDSNVGYIKLQIFGEETGKELQRAIEQLSRKHVASYILDLRNNGGGYVNAALDTCSFFLPTGSKVLSVEERDKEPEVYYSLPNLNGYKPMLVLANHYSASASEITAAALQENDRAFLFGTKTYGKASVQKIFPLPTGCALKLTIAHYLTPEGKNLNGVGVYPNQVINLKPKLNDKDPLLTESLAYLKRQAASSSLNPESLEDIYKTLEKSCGKYKIISSVIFKKNGRFYEKITAQSLKDKKLKTADFNIEKLFPY